MTPCVEVSTTVSDRELARRIGTGAVEAGLAACAQVSGPVWSSYRWRDRVEEAEEWRCTMKTTGAAWPALAGYIRGEHPYELPEIAVVPLDGTSEYLAWVSSSVSLPRPPATA